MSIKSFFRAKRLPPVAPSGAFPPLWAAHFYDRKKTPPPRSAFSFFYFFKDKAPLASGTNSAASVSIRPSSFKKYVFPSTVTNPVAIRPLSGSR